MTKKRQKRKKNKKQDRLSGKHKDDLKDILASAVQLHQQGHLQQAEMLYKSILAVDPNYADALHLLGVMAQQVGQSARALQVIDQAITINPKIAQYHFNRGVALQSLQKNAEAAKAYQAAVGLLPNYREAHENLGVALQDCYDFEGAMAAYNTAILLSDNSLLAHQNLGTLLMNTGNFHAAEKHFSRVLVLRPADGKAHLKMALALLAQGHFKEGWEHWEWRYFSESFLENNKIRIVPFPRWDGSSLAGKNVLLNPEQGIGDEIMFASCFRDVIAQANHVVIECDPRLLSLFQRSFPGTEVVPSDSSTDFYRSQSLPTIDWRIQTGSLPRFFRPDLEHFSGASAYIAVDEVRKEMWSKRLSKLDKPVNIGISWRGGTIVHARFARSIPLEKWGALFACNKANFINLQYGDHAAEIAANSQND